MSEPVTVQIALDDKPDAVLVLQPGDRLVLRYDQPLTVAQADAIIRRLKESGVRSSLVVNEARVDIEPADVPDCSCL